MMSRLLIPLAVLSFTATLQAADEMVPLFDGTTLTGWEQHSGAAEYRVQDGVIIGKTVPKTGNSFLCTAKK